MELDAQEVRFGWTWFFCVGIIAVGFSFFLFSMDELLSNSDREQRLGQTLRELRTAQFTVANSPEDLRVLGPDLSREMIESSHGSAGGHDSHGGGHH